jgi:predicted nucleic acid-binding protein
MVAYLDSSVVLRHILLGDVTIRHVLEYPVVLSSELMEIECRRVLLRCRLQDDLTDETLVEAVRRLDGVLDGVELVELSPAIKRRAMESFPVSVRTLDALHLATALAIGAATDDGKVIMFSLDRAMNLGASALGMPTPLAA